jgi:predicted enzyme related to lactoylglutathione lyase
MKVMETFFSVGVNDMARATAFYVDAFGATVSFASPRWSSLHVAGVRLGLFHDVSHAAGRVGLHFVVDVLEGSRIERAGGGVATASEVAPGVVVSDVTDSEGNLLSVRQERDH